MGLQKIICFCYISSYICEDKIIKPLKKKCYNLVCGGGWGGGGWGDGGEGN